MTNRPSLLAEQADYIIFAIASVVCAGLLAILGEAEALPVLRSTPIFPATILAAVLGFGLSLFLHRQNIPAGKPGPATFAGTAKLLAVAAALALPPVAIDLLRPFPREMNLPVPAALAFYPAIALVAEVAFHLAPMAILTAVLPRSSSLLWVLVPAILVEPAFQAALMPGEGLVRFLVFLNVTLISAVQIWLYRRKGFSAMMGLRLAFYLFWHVLWGTARLAILF